LKAIEKWDGKLPMYQGGAGPIPFLGKHSKYSLRWRSRWRREPQGNASDTGTKMSKETTNHVSMQHLDII